nr:TPA_asm: ATP synthase F0 subunit 8 [Pseudomyrmex gracilis]
MPQMGPLYWMPLLCLNMILLYFVISSIHYTIMISPKKSMKKSLKPNIKWSYSY